MIKPMLICRFLQKGIVHNKFVPPEQTVNYFKAVLPPYHSYETRHRRESVAGSHPRYPPELKKYCNGHAEDRNC